MHNVALKFLKEAAKKGWTFKVGNADDGGWTGEGYDYEGNGPVAAWNAVKEVTMEWVEVYDGNTYLGAVYLMILGVVAIVVMLKAPDGLWGFIHRRFRIELFPIQRRVRTQPVSQESYQRQSG